MLVRDALDGRRSPGIEVCMLRRNLSSEFVAGVYVFPGGAVDPDDGGPESERLCRGMTDAAASTTLGVDQGGLAFWVAAMRECFEEAGVLLAQRRHDPAGEGSQPLDTSDPEVARRFAAHRDAVNQGRLRLVDVCQQEDLLLTADTVHYVAHWVTPELFPRRFDTRFFVTVAPPGQVARHDDGETIATIWIRPEDALARGESGEIDLLPPTMANLRSIRPFGSTAGVMAWAAGLTEVPVVLPIVIVEDGHVLVLRPGEDGYEQALDARAVAGAESQTAVAEAVRRALGPKP